MRKRSLKPDPNLLVDRLADRPLRTRQERQQRIAEAAAKLPRIQPVQPPTVPEPPAEDDQEGDDV